MTDTDEDTGRESPEEAAERLTDAARSIRERAEAIREQLDRWETGAVDEEAMSLDDVIAELDRWETSENDGSE